MKRELRKNLERIQREFRGFGTKFKQILEEFRQNLEVFQPIQKYLDRILTDFRQKLGKNQAELRQWKVVQNTQPTHLITFKIKFRHKFTKIS